MKLVVIEGIGKKETVEKYLGKGYRVFATKGHVRDLPTKTLAVNVKNDFEPKYVIMDDKKEIVEQLKSAASKAEEVLLATDPDREGEAISWHVAHILGIPADSPVRIEFNEISKKAVQNALQHPRVIDANLVDAQQARRVLDRLVGYKISPVLCKKIQSKLSAGRVQSVTLRLVVEREREIQNFKPEEYWPFFSLLHNHAGAKIKASLATRDKQKFKIGDEQTVRDVIADLDGKTYEVTGVKKSVTKSKPPAPFITSTMQQDALNKLGMSLKQTSSAAQALYEGVDLPGEGKVALITYIRTDSTRVSADAVREAREYISEKFGKDFIPAKPNVYATKKGAQDAHEAIRPITLSRTPESIRDSVNKYYYRLYKLIYDRFMASQMSEATYNSLAVDISAGRYGFKVNGKVPLFPGYTAVYNMYVDESKEEEEASAKLPDLSVGERLAFDEYKYEQKFTKPPARYTEASLVKSMEEKGIGRPATYTPTVTLLATRNYTEKEGKFIKPTALGMEVTDMLVKYFPDIMDIRFTADMEKRLDEIEDGGVIWQSVVRAFYDGFEEKIAAALGDSFSLKAPDQKTDVPCPTCGALMVIKSGRSGKFFACPNYPKCKTTLSYDEETGKPVPHKTPHATPTDVVCPKCGSPMVLKEGRYGPFLSCSAYPKCKCIVDAKERNAKPAPAAPKAKEAAQAAPTDTTAKTCPKCGKPLVQRDGRFGPFLACSGYPSCRYIENTGKQDEQTADSAPCPKCGKPLKVIKAHGSIFYGCTGYPECKFTSNSPVAEKKCPQCGGFMYVRKYKDGTHYVCASKDCNYNEKAD